MKKILLFGLFSVVLTQSFAQVKVANNGNTLFGYPTSNTPLSTISVNCEGKQDSKVAIQGTEVGLYTRRAGYAHWGNAIQGVSDNPNVTFSVGVKAESYNGTPLNSGRSYGVFGTAGNATSGWNYGVFGRLQGTQNGAGVYGTVTHNENGINTQGRYAGYFNGPTKVVGDLHVTGSIYGVVLGQAALANNVSNAKSYSQAVNYETTPDYANKLGRLSLISYYMPHNEEAQAKTFSASGDTIASTHSLTVTELQCLEKKHYALSAEQLQDEFPDLVYEQEDGSKAINYVEMIPVLIQTINELNNKISKLESSSLLVDNHTTDIGNLAQEGIALYQNTPNPFNTYTTIKLSIPQNTKQAAVYFYNMNGVNIKTYNIGNRGNVSIKISASDFQPSLYVYALVIDGKVIATKRMIVAK
jgi:hypothetical protein